MLLSAVRTDKSAGCACRKYIKKRRAEMYVLIYHNITYAFAVCFGIILVMETQESAPFAYDDPLVHYDQTDARSLDLRPLGIACIPRLGFSRYSSNRCGTDYHSHPRCIEICLCLRGNLYFESDGTQYPFFPGRVFVSRPDQPHRMRNNPKGLRTMDMLFQLPAKGRTVLGLPRRESDWLVKKLLNPTVRLFPATDAIRMLFPRLFLLHDENDLSSEEKSLKLRSCALALLLAVADAPNACPERNSLPSPALKTVIELMASNPMAEYRTEEIARRAGLSDVAFFDAFKRATGFSPHAFILDRRVQLAQRDLMDGIKVGDVSAKYGFPSPQHFATVFKNITGMTPPQCRRGCPESQA